jgi:polysaccharide export outer membrane protein
VLFGAGLLIAAMPALAQQANPKVAPRDQLKITVLAVAQWSREYPVSADGTVDFPELGAVKVAGLTAAEIEGELIKQLRARQIHTNPQITVEINQSLNKRVNVLGLVRVVGPIAYAGDMTLLDAITKSGGRLPESSDEVLVVRASAPGGNDFEQIRINIRELENGDLSRNIVLQDGDSIIVQKAQPVFVSGEVKAQGAYTVESGTTVRQVIAIAGGVTERGNDKKIEIKRTVDGKEQTIKNVKLNDIVKPGDTVIVHRRIW